MYRLETAFLFLVIGPLVGALPFISLFFWEDVLKGGNVSVLLIPLVFSYFCAGIPALLTGIFHQWFVYRRDLPSTLGGHLASGFFAGFLIVAVYSWIFFSKGNDKDWAGCIQLSFLGAVSGAICAFLDRWRRNRGWCFDEDAPSLP